MWQAALIMEGVLVGVLFAWVRWRCRSWRMGVVVAVFVILPLVACAHRPEPTKAMRWQGACQVCEVTT